jgi:type I restriction enzyme, S subunit
MISVRYKNSILFDAFKGNLTVQKNDYSLELLSQIIKIKNTNKTHKILEIRDDEFPHDIPNNWCWARLDDISFKITDGSHNPPANSGDGIPLLSAANIHDGRVNYHEANRYITQKQWEDENKRTQLSKGDVLLTVVGTIGRTAVVESDLRFALQRSVAVISSGINPRYLAYYLSIKENYMHMAKGTAQLGIYLNTVKRLLIPVAPLEEQNRIVEKLDHVLPLIDELGKDEIKLKDLMQKFPEKMSSSVLLSAMEGKLLEQNSAQMSLSSEIFSKLNPKTLQQDLEDYNYNYPENWVILELDKICVLSTGNSINETVKKTKYIRKIDGYSYIGTKDVNYDHSIDYDNGVYIPFEEDFRIAKKNSTILCIEGGSAGRKVGLLDRDVCYGNKLVSIYSEILNPKFVFYFVKSPVFKSQFYDLMSGMIGGVGINKIKKIRIPIPPLSEQEQIVKKLNEILPIVEKINNEQH